MVCTHSCADMLIAPEVQNRSVPKTQSTSKFYLLKLALGILALYKKPKMQTVTLSREHSYMRNKLSKHFIYNQQVYSSNSSVTKAVFRPKRS